MRGFAKYGEILDDFATSLVHLSDTIAPENSILKALRLASSGAEMKRLTRDLVQVCS